MPPKGVDGKSSPNLYVANCGAAVGLSIDAISSVFSTFGEVNGVYAADESGTRVIVSYINENAAQASLKALHGRPWPDLGGRFLHIQYSILEPPKQTRNVNTTQHMGELPSFVFSILGRIALISDLDDDDANIVLDQLTGLASWSSGGISEGVFLPKPNSDTDSKAETPDSISNFTRRAIYLRPSITAIVIWGGTVDLVKDSVIRRGSRRVSFTFRKTASCPSQFLASASSLLLCSTSSNPCFEIEDRQGFLSNTPMFGG
ncbi:RNA-binding (RRM/RBD/RNP motifs) family protein [Actinidia rufa]|uniref:RNA-binding (RRM/RBD/RNP motifs) family protein n=1 Tax=Actinidia rufa TaxID=165716 RepID=A0A7J0GZS4_9ERIC|nr:RNA-binding (RRM/RBD/RNP motifs) family protein [Actinidia rufa]